MFWSWASYQGRLESMALELPHHGNGIAYLDGADDEVTPQRPRNFDVEVQKGQEDQEDHSIPRVALVKADSSR